MILILIMVSTVGLLTYREFVKVLDNAKESGKSDPIVSTTKNLIFSLTQAENKVKTYTLTQDSVFLGQYHKYNKDIRVRLKTLEFEMRRTNIKDVPLDTLKDLVQKKLDVYDSLLILQNEFRVQQALQKVTQSIEDVKEEITTTEEEKRFLFFKRRKKNQATPQTEIRVDYDEVKNNLQQIQSDETSREEQQLQKEFALLQQDRNYTDKIQKILNTLENQSLIHDKERAAETKRIVQNANMQVIIFCVIISILLIFTSATIIRYITKSTRYRKVLKRAKNEAESLAQAKEHFVATVSHEIRTPMNIISGFTEQLSNSKLNPQQRDQLQTVIKASSHLLNLINEVLDFTKLQNYKLQLEANDFYIREVIQEVQDLMTPLAEAKAIDLEFNIADSVPEVVVGDPIRLSQILINVTSNAIKFTNEGMVSVSVSSIMNENNQAMIEFSVTDTGIGMSEDQIARVFEAFEQAEISTTRTYGGTGLGLSITKKLIELHNGRVDVHSRQGVGTEVLIELPYQIGDASNIQDESQISSDQLDLSDYLILVADDEPFNRKLLVTILNKYNTEIIEVTNGREAIDAAARRKFDLILMDARMPMIDGVSASKEIRKEGENTETPIIALSAAVSPEDRAEYENAGMNGFVPKPFKEATLINKILEMLNVARPKDDEGIEITDMNGNLDFTELKSLSNGDQDFYIEMLETFITGTADGIEKMKEAFGDNDMQTVSNLAHKISSPCKHLNAMALYSTLKEIENLAGESPEEKNTIENLIQKANDQAVIILEEVRIELKPFKEAI